MGNNMLSEEKLPLEYRERMKDLLKDDYSLYIESLSKDSFLGLRVNNLKVDNKEVIKLLGKEFKKVAWEDSAYYISKEDKLAKNFFYYAGLYYLQEPSAMSAASLLEVKKGDRVLDLCAAPGGKSTKIASNLDGSGVLVSNDISNTRAKALLKNIEMFGVKNCLITCESPKALSKVYENYFDKILVDAPCSGEGMFRKDKNVLNEYIKRGSEFFVPIQKEILSYAGKMLKKGGELLYSTCTYSKLENEDVIQDFLEKNEDFYVENLRMYEGFEESKYLAKAVRLYPHKLDGEGHFVCKLKRRSDEKIKEVINKKEEFKNSQKIDSLVLKFLEDSNLDFDVKRFYTKNEYVYYLPKDCKIDKNLRYLRTGLLIGRINNKRFEPSQAFAMSLKKEDWKYVLDLDKDDVRVLKYLKGETIEANIKDKKYILVCINSFSLGFAKQDGMKLKNKYYKGWRIN